MADSLCAVMVGMAGKRANESIQPINNEKAKANEKYLLLRAGNKKAPPDGRA